MFHTFPNRLRYCLAVLVLTGLPLTALAHPGHFEHIDAMSMFNQGLLHPLTGPDHLLAMLAVGIWSAMAYPSLKRAVYIPLSFSSILLFGALMGIAGMQVPLVEPLIMASLLVLGLMLAGMARLSLITGSALVAFFAFFHGAAHGMELPEGGPASLFIVGFMLSTLFIHCAGMVAGAIMTRHKTWVARLTGAGIASYGAVLLLTGQ